MNASQLDHFRKILKEVAVRIHGDVLAVREQATAGSGGQASGELSNAPTHLGDMGTDEFMHDLNATLLENEQYLINEADAATRRLEEGTYGQCQNCGCEITVERLEAVPYARWCVQCAQAATEGPSVNFNAGRPHSPADTFAPEGDMGDNQRPTIQAPSSDKTPKQSLPPDSDVEPSDFE